MAKLHENFIPAFLPFSFTSLNTDCSLHPLGNEKLYILYAVIEGGGRHEKSDIVFLGLLSYPFSLCLPSGGAAAQKDGIVLRSHTAL